MENGDPEPLTPTTPTAPKTPTSPSVSPPSADITPGVGELY